MVRISVIGPREDELLKKFGTYQFYLQCICEEIDTQYANDEVFGRVCYKRTEHLQGFSEFERPWVERWLKIAWNTEYLMGVGPVNIDLIRFNNHWKPIQAYYAVYAASEAVAYLIDGQKADGHEKALRKITEYLVRNKLSPWDKAYSGPKGRSGNDHRSVNFPHMNDLPHNLQRRDVNHIEMVAKCLKAEHQHRIDDLFSREKGSHKHSFNPGYTGILHFLYEAWGQVFTFKG